MFFDKVLVANRGEIACRVLRTCRDLGLATVAVYSDADADAPHVAAADEAVRLGPAPPAESYLKVAAVIEAARRTGAQAIHPGYGFLAENAAFVEACEAAGLVFIGPRAETVRAMGDKASARRLMAERGVPVVPGYDGEDQRDETLMAAALTVGYPLLVKASAGGGGKGMNVVRRPEDLGDALAQARRLAKAAFGDDRLILEKYVALPRHVEVQILGDRHGQVVHVFERECSVQRRFQKIIEESPSPALDDALRARLCEAGVTAGQALGYQGAGTVEFILDATGAFYFLEVNTRLQVEHPVTEAITGLDLVAWQIKVACGGRLPPQDAIARKGHAMECRLYAEDPGGGFLPATGRLLEWAPPEGPGVRVDAGVVEGSEVGIHYDPLLAKLITHGPDRDTALWRMLGALRRLGCQGVTTNRDFLVAVLRHPAFRAGTYTTHFIPDHLGGWAPQVRPAILGRRAVAATLFEVLAGQGRGPVPGLRPGWRNNPFGPEQREWLVGEQRLRIPYRATDGAGGFEVILDGRALAARAHREGDRGLALELSGVTRRFVVVVDGNRRLVRDADGQSVLVAAPRFPEAEAIDDMGGCVAPMPGKVVRVLVAPEQTVAKGQALVILEAMKMEQMLQAPHAGTVTDVRCEEGAQVDAGAVLVVVEAEAE
ncbi:MAG: ATP-grasp domain-containing protein [Myxococcales bacterium]|nr:ATP-grasp domain-containing protein [Myxococcales bacterium]